MSVRMSKGKTKRKYSQEFKENAVQLCLTRTTTVRQIAAELGVTEKILHRWKRELAASKSTGIRFAPVVRTNSTHRGVLHAWSPLLSHDPLSTAAGYRLTPLLSAEGAVLYAPLVASA